MKPTALVSPKSMNILLVGNNPIDLSDVHDHLKGSRTVQYELEFAFGITDIQKKIRKFKPDCILIDDNIDKIDMSYLLKKLATNAVTAKIPITIIQNSNKDDAPREGADEFILKNTITSDSIARTLLNSLKVHDMKEYLKEAYKKRKSEFLKFK